MNDEHAFGDWGEIMKWDLRIEDKSEGTFADLYREAMQQKSKRRR